MGVAIEVYRAKIGMFMRKIKECGSVWARWFFNKYVLCGTGGHEASGDGRSGSESRTATDQLKLNLILEHVKNQGHKTETFREIMKVHSQEVTNARKGIDDLGPKFDLLNEAINSVINDYNQIKLAVRRWEERQEVVDHKVLFGRWI
jgi:hypothetical protein